MKDKNKQYLTIAIILFPAIFFWILINKFSLNIPRWDDYDAVLLFMNGFLDSADIFAKIKLIFTKHNEHLIVFPKLVMLAQYYISGVINFKVLSIIGDIAWYLIFLLSYFEFRKTKLPLYCFLPVPFIFFQASHREHISWAMPAIQNFYVVLFAFAALYFIAGYYSQNDASSLNAESKDVRSTKKISAIVLGIILSVMAAYTSGGGIFAVYIASFYSAYKKRWKEFSVLLAIAVAIHISYIKTGGGSESIQILLLLKNLFAAILYYFAFIGSFVQNKYLAVPAGIIMTILFLYTAFRQYYKDKEYLILIICFICVTGAVITLVRFTNGINQAISSRYSMYSISFLVILYYVFIERYKSDSRILKRYATYVLCFSVLYFCTINVIKGRHIISKYNELMRGAVGYVCNKDESNLNYPDTNKAKILIESSKAKHIYDINVAVDLRDCKR